MAGTMPHAIFVETNLVDGGAAAHAAELPGCATFGPTVDEAVGGMPARALRFTEWLRSNGEDAPAFVGDNWYEVERGAAGPGPDGRAAFSLDELPPSRDEFAAWLRWMELARESLADALDASGSSDAGAVIRIAAQDIAFASALGGSAPRVTDDPVDAAYTARDALTAALEAAGPGAAGVRRILRLAIADDLRLADRLRSGG
ncbi:MAG TPA: hypothetical protein VJA85_06590 [Candidatus Limnocylindria bacterium]|nr:hypothetical protein [Candidatus Limnocylindria bacterium]